MDEDLNSLRGKHVIVAATGCIGAMFLPNWVSWLRATLPETRLEVVVTRSALKFVTRDSIRPFLGKDVLVDSWYEESHPHPHIDFTHGIDAYLVHPASMNFVSRLSSGACDTPLMLGLQGTRKPVVIGASAPPEFVKGHMWPEYVSRLAARPNVRLLSPVEGTSAIRDDAAGSPPPLFVDTVSVLASACEELADE